MRAGFTLLELLVAIAIGTLALTVGYASLAALGDVRERIREHEADLSRAMNVRLALTEWLANADVVTDSAASYELRALARDRSGQPDDHFAFRTSAAQPLTLEPARVLLYIDRDRGTPETGLIAEVTSLIDGETRRVELHADATGLMVEFIRAGGSHWARGWPATFELPAGARITTVFQRAEAAVAGVPVVVLLGGSR